MFDITMLLFSQASNRLEAVEGGNFPRLAHQPNQEVHQVGGRVGALHGNGEVFSRVVRERDQRQEFSRAQVLIGSDKDLVPQGRVVLLGDRAGSDNRPGRRRWRSGRSSTHGRYAAPGTPPPERLSVLCVRLELSSALPCGKLHLRLVASLTSQRALSTMQCTGGNSQEGHSGSRILHKAVTIPSPSCLQV